ncbi:MAG TPA: hypothetical protein VGE34_01925 [Candidatus Saccharimonadales bacterium]
MRNTETPSRFFYDSIQGVTDELAESIVDAKHYDPSVRVDVKNEVTFSRPERMLTQKNVDAILRIARGYEDTLEEQFGIRVQIVIDTDSVRTWAKTGMGEQTAGWEKFQAVHDVDQIERVA